MAITPHQYEHYLTLYGADLHAWPDALREEAAQLSRLPGYAGLLEAQRKLEQTLRERPFEEARYGLADRIIATARNKPQITTANVLLWLRDAVAELVSPRPAYALAATLALGFVLGLGNPSPGTADDGADYVLQLYTDDEGTVL